MSVPENSRRKICAVIPAYCEEARIGPVVQAVRRHGLDVVVIDDGSPDATAAVAEAAGAVVLRHERNRGKGAALNTGFEYARKHGYEAVITMDADGQHVPDEIPKFLDAYKRFGSAVLIGNRMWNPSGMPLIRRWTNRFMSWLLSRVMGQYVPDTQCGFRMYRCDILPVVVGKSERFDAESEILLNIASHRIPMESVRISTVYAGERSKIRPTADTVRFIKMLWKFARAQKATATEK